MAIDAPIPAIPPVAHPPPTSVNPNAAAQAVVAPEPPDRWTALKQVGWWKPVDWLMLVFLGGHILAGLFCLMFHVGSLMGLVVGLLNCCIILAVWLVMLVYRAMDFVLQMRANLEMLPFDAARIAVAFLQQGGK